LGAKDRGITPEDVQKFLEQFHALGKVLAIEIDPQAGHAFENPNNQAVTALAMPPMPGKGPANFSPPR
jgi:hypothetical protein